MHKVRFSFIVSVTVFFMAFNARLQRFADWGFWGDEIRQLSYTLGPFKPVWQRLLYGDMTAFPGDYILTYPFYRYFGINKWALVFPHIVACVLSFYVLYLLCRVYFKTLWGYLFAFILMGFNANLIFHAFEYRPYAVLPLLSLASFYFSYLITRRLDLKPKQKFWIGVFFVFTVCFHAFGIFIVVLPILFHLLNKWIENKTWVVLKEDLKFFSGVFVVVLPVWLWYSSLTIPVHPWNDQVFDPFKYIPNPLEHPLGFTKKVLDHLLGNKIFYIFLPAMALTPWFCSRTRVKHTLFFLILIVCPLILICFTDFLNNFLFLQRQFVWVMPLFAFFIAWQWDVFLSKCATGKEEIID